MEGVDNMQGVDITYRVVGRYVDGQKITGYHLVGSDGSQLPVDKDLAIYMISNGKIENMRIQSDTSSDKNGIIIRGKGVNLTKLPTYDEKKNTFRGDSNSQAVANNKIQPKKDSGLNPMGQFKLVGRIMRGNICMGYVVEDRSGSISRFSRSKVLNLGIQKLISNAEVHKIKSEGNTEAQFILRGRGCSIKDLPILIVNDDGKIIDPNKKETGTSFRAMRVRRSGLIFDKATNTKKPFNAGSYLICGVGGNIKIETTETVIARYVLDKELSSAMCDNYLENISNYSIELFGQPPVNLSKDMILKWGILKIKETLRKRIVYEFGLQD